jgi:hypothetical protein
MNIISTSGRDSNHIHAEIDQEARQVFSAFSQGLILVHRSLASSPNEFLSEDILFASRFCAQLGEHPNGSMEILIVDVRRAFATTMDVCSAQRRRIGPPYGLSVVLHLLACMTPVPVPRAILPPAVKLFGKERVDEEYFMAYERVRLWRNPGNPELQMLLASHLLGVLGSHDSVPKCVQIFVESLECVTAVFRDTVSSLHQSALDDADGRREGERR